MDIKAWLQDAASGHSCQRQKELSTSWKSTPSEIQHDRFLRRKQFHGLPASSGSFVSASARAELKCTDRLGFCKNGREQTPAERFTLPISREKDKGSCTTELSDSPFRKRKRHKPNRKSPQRTCDKYRAKTYEEKGENVRDKDRKQRSKESNKNDRSTRRAKDGDRPLKSFKPKNVGDNRITLRPSCNVGLFNRVRASSNRATQGLPDLVFPQMRFFSKDKRNQPSETEFHAETEIRFPEALLERGRDQSKKASKSNEVNHGKLHNAQQGKDELLILSDHQTCSGEDALTGMGSQTAEFDASPADSNQIAEGGNVSTTGRLIPDPSKPLPYGASTVSPPLKIRGGVLKPTARGATARLDRQSTYSSRSNHLSIEEPAEWQRNSFEEDGTIIGRQGHCENVDSNMEATNSWGDPGSYQIANLLLVCHDTVESYWRTSDVTRAKGSNTPARDRTQSRAKVLTSHPGRFERDAPICARPENWNGQMRVAEQNNLPWDEQREALELTSPSIPTCSDSDKSEIRQNHGPEAFSENYDHHVQTRNATDGVLICDLMGSAPISSGRIGRPYTDLNSAIHDQNSSYGGFNRSNEGSQVITPPNFWRPNKLY